jgi:hypothetical protein
MALSDAMKKLARIVPGIAGCQDRETLRDTDKAVRKRNAHGKERFFCATRT